ncbi:AMP-binding protein [Pseudomonas sp. HR96]|uniref:AMP-binding protein n=1 Tax=Pseudomonas sp. HR96 TaxID=1027966 RepID=UPI002A7665BB|nr:AMP-binding protein [Pseudomonas sp. HR96]WPP00652.1 AMP-binding protein [Pseudomonas sp. HR96]
MSVHEHDRPPLAVVPAAALLALRRWAAERPQQLALRHRRQGAWQAWRWSDVVAQVERGAAGLRAQGFAEGSRLAVCGAFEPSLLIVVLAAHSLGGQVRPISRHSRGDALREQLLQAQAGYAYVQRREEVSQWRQASPQLPAPLRLYCPDASAAIDGDWHVLPLATLFGAADNAPGTLAWRHAHADPAVWVEQGTEWPEGLSHLLQRWLDRGEGFAFPETSESASRDRRDIRPAALLLSSERVQALADEIEARLAPLGSWRRRLCDWTLRNPRHGLRRWLHQRVRGLLGFSRLTEIDSPAPSRLPLRATAPASWLHPVVERAA